MVPAKLSAATPANTSIPDKLFAGKKICLAGRFSYNPSKEDLRKFLLAEGAKLETKVSDKLDLLLVGAGAKSASQKKAEALNAKGALIEICEDLTSLLALDISQMPHVVTDAQLLKRYGNLPGFLHPAGQPAVFQGDDFSKSQIGGTPEPINIGLIRFSGCSFDGAQLSNLVSDTSPRYHTPNQFYNFEHCTFKSGELTNVYLGSVATCVFEQTKASSLSFRFLDDSTFRQAVLEKLDVNWIQRCSFEKTKISAWQLEGYGGNIVQSQFVDCVIKDSAFPKRDCTEVQDSKFKKLLFEKIDFSSTSFTACEFDDVEFKDCTFTDITFAGCTLRNCRFNNTKGGTFDLCDSSVAKCVAQDLEASMLNGSQIQLKQIRGLAAAAATDFRQFKLLQDLSQTAIKSTRLQLSLTGEDAEGNHVSLNFDRQWSFDFNYKVADTNQRSASFRITNYRTNPNPAEISKGLLRLIRESGISEIDLRSLKVKTSKCALKSTELKQLIVNAVYEGLGKEPQSEAELAAAQKKLKDETAALRKEMQAELASGDVAKFNKRTTAQRKQVANLKKLQLAKAALPKLNASGLDLSEGNFVGADLSAANLNSTTLRNAKLSHAKLAGANLSGCNLRGCDLSQADLTGANLQRATLKEIVAKGAIFADVNLSKTDLCGVDLSQAKLQTANLKGSSYDEKTQLPKSIKQSDMKNMRWVGGGVPPHERKQNKKTAGPIDFPQFMARLNEITDASRLQKSTQMLKKDAFQLFSEVSDTAVAGVVKSQSDKDLVYSCALDEEGQFACCTQNLNPCGGLRGALCKHILVLIVGLAKSNELDPTKIDQWVNSSKLKQPALDKDRMSEILLKYKGAEAGEIDWRPTETVPEDFFAF